eukprot:3473518-Alexandrium_andersonii.AAC.1
MAAEAVKLLTPPPNGDAVQPQSCPAGAAELAGAPRGRAKLLLACPVHQAGAVAEPPTEGSIRRAAASAAG